MASEINDEKFSTNKMFLALISAIITVYTYLTLPIYWLIQKPYEKIEKSKTKRSKQLNSNDLNSPWIGIHENPVLKNTLIDYCETLNDFRQKHQQFISGHHDAIGYRNVLYEYFETDKNGRRFKKRKLSDEYQWISFDQMWKRVENIAIGLRLANIDKHEPIVFLCETCAEFLMMEFAIAKAGLVQANVFNTLGESGIEHAIRQTNAKYMFVSWDLLPKVRSTLVKNNDVNIHKIIYIRRRAQKCSKEILDAESNYLEPFNGIEFIPFDEIESKGESYTGDSDDLCQPLDKDEVSLIVFTSGTTGVPKGVQLTQKQIVKSALTSTSAITDLAEKGTKSTFAGFLPQAHIFEAIVEFTALAIGMRIGFVNPLTLVDGAPGLSPDSRSDLSVLKPTVMIVAPLLLQRIHTRIYNKLEAKSSFHVALFDYLIDYKLYWTQKGYSTPLINRLICSKVRVIFGGQLDKIIAGGAPLSPQLQAFCKMAMDTNLVQGYGMTETCGAVLCMDRYDLSFGRCGTPLLNVYIKLEDWLEGDYRVTDRPNPRGELLVGMKTQWKGYLNAEHLTAEGYMMDEKNGIHYVRTGDIAQAHPDGTFEIIDRKKDIAKLANGEYVSLGKIETTLKNCSHVDQSCVFGNGFADYLVALIVPNKDKLKSIAINGTTKSMKEINKILLKSITETGIKCGLKPREIPTRIEIVMDEWTPENDMLTAALKLKRNAIRKRYHDLIDEMFINQTLNHGSH